MRLAFPRKQRGEQFWSLVAYLADLGSPGMAGRPIATFCKLFEAYVYIALQPAFENELVQDPSSGRDNLSYLQCPVLRKTRPNFYKRTKLSSFLIRNIYVFKATAFFVKETAESGVQTDRHQGLKGLGNSQMGRVMKLIRPMKEGLNNPMLVQQL